MQFASVPAWLAFVAAGGVASLSLLAYRRLPVPLSAPQRGTLAGLRALSLAVITLLLLRPMVLVRPQVAGGVVVPVLIDVSRSMGIADADGTTRQARAVSLLKSTLLPTLAKHARVELFGVGDGVRPVDIDGLRPSASKTDLTGALSAIRDRYRGQAIGGIVLVSDGGDTGSRDRETKAGGPPIFAFGVGSPEGPADREVTAIAGGDPRLDQASIDLHVSAVSRGFDNQPFELRVLANGQAVAARQVMPRDGVPVDEAFTVFPDPAVATVYTAEIAAAPAETITANNSRSLVVNPAGRKRRILVLAGAPGYDYSFLVRALGQDPSFEVDSVVRKGKNDQNVDTFIVQAGAARGQSLTSGFPSSREALSAYDGLIILDIEGTFFTRAQLGLAADFVSERGGGLLVAGGRSFEQRGLSGTALEEALPVEPTERMGNVVSPIGEGDGAHDTITLTADGQNHPIMRLGTTEEESRRQWSSLPALAFSTPVGGPRPGALVLAVTTASSGAILPVVAVQRYGRGRSMVFAGEASWRWRMMLPATDRRYEIFWRQALRWLTAAAPYPVSLTLQADPEPGDVLTMDVEVRDAAFVPVAGATLSGTVTAPGGSTTGLSFRASGAGRFVADTPVEAPGLYRLRVDASRGASALGSAEHWAYAGTSSREFDDPRLNEPLLKRLARQSGGDYARAADASNFVPRLTGPPPVDLPIERRDLWHEPWFFALVAALLSAEWVLRRSWGLR